MTKSKGSEFLKYCIPIINVLKDLGGSGRPAEVTDSVIDKLNIPEEEQEVTNKNGGSRVKNQIAWARFYMVKADLLDSSRRGVWSLTEKASNDDINTAYIQAMFKTVQADFSKKRNEKEEEKESDSEEDAIDDAREDSDYKKELLSTLQSLPPSGFERICQRLLRESGFQQVAVTGKTGDGGIDGHGILQINPLVSFKVLFQCKRYQGVVSVSTVRDFRGALQGRADKGIILTTGNFTTDAKKEALRDGATPIELVDGEKLVEMFEDLSLGLIPKKDFDIDSDFFNQFKEIGKQ